MGGRLLETAGFAHFLDEIGPSEASEGKGSHLPMLGSRQEPWSALQSCRNGFDPLPHGTPKSADEDDL